MTLARQANNGIEPTPEAWYVVSDGAYYHHNANCEVGQRIAPDDRLAGEGGRRLCPECKALSQREAP